MQEVLEKLLFFPILRDNKFAMNIRFIVGIIIFSLTFGFSSALTRFTLGERAVQPFGLSSSNRTQRRITRLLRKDISNGRERNRKIYAERTRSESYSVKNRFIDEAQAVIEYAKASSSIDDANLPEDFRAAWQSHMKAWSEQAELLNKANSCSAVKHFADAEEISRIYDEQDKEISRTWYETLRVAREHGASIPYDAY